MHPQCMLVKHFYSFPDILLSSMLCSMYKILYFGFPEIQVFWYSYILKINLSSSGNFLVMIFFSPLEIKQIEK